MPPLLLREAGDFLCLAFFIYYFLRCALTDTSRDKRRTVLSLCCLIASIGGFQLVALQGTLRTARYDLYIYRIDHILHVGEPGAAMGRVLLNHTSIFWAMSTIYSLPSVVVLLLLFEYDSKPQFREVLYALLFNFSAAFLVYAAIPVSGPWFAFSSYPLIPPVVAPHVIHLNAPPNAIPSIHMATALLVCWYLRKRPITSILAGLFLILTIVVILASGQHYVFDLILAVPYAAAAAATGKAICRRSDEAGELLDRRDRPSLQNDVEIGL